MTQLFDAGAKVGREACRDDAHMVGCDCHGGAQPMARLFGNRAEVRAAKMIVQVGDVTLRAKHLVRIEASTKDRIAVDARKPDDLFVRANDGAEVTVVVERHQVTHRVTLFGHALVDSSDGGYLAELRKKVEGSTN